MTQSKITRIPSCLFAPPALSACPNLTFSAGTSFKRLIKPLELNSLNIGSDVRSAYIGAPDAFGKPKPNGARPVRRSSAVAASCPVVDANVARRKSAANEKQMSCMDIVLKGPKPFTSKNTSTVPVDMLGGKMLPAHLLNKKLTSSVGAAKPNLVAQIPKAGNAAVKHTASVGALVKAGGPKAYTVQSVSKEPLRAAAKTKPNLSASTASSTAKTNIFTSVEENLHSGEGKGKGFSKPSPAGPVNARPKVSVVPKLDFSSLPRHGEPCPRTRSLECDVSTATYETKKASGEDAGVLGPNDDKSSGLPKPALTASVNAKLTLSVVPILNFSSLPQHEEQCPRSRSMQCGASAATSKASTTSGESDIVLLHADADPGNKSQQIAQGTIVVQSYGKSCMTLQVVTGEELRTHSSASDWDDSPPDTPPGFSWCPIVLSKFAVPNCVPPLDMTALATFQELDRLEEEAEAAACEPASRSPSVFSDEYGSDARDSDRNGELVHREGKETQQDNDKLAIVDQSKPKESFYHYPRLERKEREEIEQRIKRLPNEDQEFVTWIWEAKQQACNNTEQMAFRGHRLMDEICMQLQRERVIFEKKLQHLENENAHLKAMLECYPTSAQ